MADKTIAERLQPSLLDRLTDSAPDSKTESRNDRVIDITQLREIIKRDLSWLLNTSNQDSQIDAARFPNVAKSVLNFGVREVAGDFSTDERAQIIRGSIRRAIERFEPRIMDGSLDVDLNSTEQTSGTVVTFDIRADMWAQPSPLELYLRSEVDTTTGELRLERKV